MAPDRAMSTMGGVTSFYDEIGGMDTIRTIVDTFYAGVAEDPIMRPMYPEEDLGPAAERLSLFLAQYWGGPKTYSEQRGHPRLRMRHVPFAVTPDMRDRWLLHMMNAVDTLDLDEAHDAALRDYLTRAAYMLVNRHEEPTG